jgi:hypothetical protein
MPCKKIGNAIVCYNRAYKYKSIYFEYNNMTGLSRLNKDGSISTRLGRKFLELFEEWWYLPKKERDKYEVTE